MVISAEGPTSTSQPSDPLTVGALPPPSDLAFSVSRPRSKRQPLRLDHAEPGPGREPERERMRWNLRSRAHSLSGGDPSERPRFSVALSGEEIAEDIYAVTGSLPRRRPKKRPRLLQRQIDLVFPGTWLTEITLELYKVPEQR